MMRKLLPSEKHRDALNHYFNSPNEIEHGFRPLFKEFGAGNWKRIDILGIDKNECLCIVEIKTQKGKIDARKQVLKYRASLLKLFHALRLNVPIRVLLITPDERIDFGATSTFEKHIKIPKSDLPTSSEIYGLKRKRPL